MYNFFMFVQIVVILLNKIKAMSSHKPVGKLPSPKSDNTQVNLKLDDNSPLALYLICSSVMSKQSSKFLVDVSMDKCSYIISASGSVITVAQYLNS